MAKKTFIPNWYLHKKSVNLNKKIRICSTAVLLANIILFSFILNISSKIKNIEKILPDKNSSGILNNGEIIKASKLDIIAIDKYKEISSFFDENNISYKKLLINKSDLQIDMEVKSYNEYISFIRYIENEYSIKKLTPITKIQGNFNFTVILEV
jgi:hypothetical protein